MIVLTIILSGDAVSFSDCFSPRSYMNGNELTNQLNLHLIPYESIDLITSENLCRSYLPGKVVVAQVHYDDITFPKALESQVKFKYVYNKEIVVTFQLSPADYLHITGKDHAMYELWYDVNLIKVNSSISTIELTNYNGTNCFQKLELEYTMYGDMDVRVLPNSCAVKVDPSLQVYVEFQEGLVNSQIPIYPCVSDCDPAEFQLSQTDFSLTKLYRVKKTPATETQLASFYSHFIENRRIQISLNLKFDTNGIFTVVSRIFDNLQAKDTLGCKVHDTHLGIYAVLNPRNVQIQFRDSFTNKLICDMLNVVSVRAEMYLWDDNLSEHISDTFLIGEFNQQVGIAFKNTNLSDSLRQSFNANSKTIMIISYLDNFGLIQYELIVYKDPFYVACVTRATLHLYKNQSCIDYTFDSNPQCLGNRISAADKNTLGVFYKENGITYSLGLYRFHIPVDYSQINQRLCFVCDQFFPDTVYAKQTCAENQELTKLKLKTAQLGLAIISKYEFIIFNQVVAEYQNIFVPFIAVTCALVVMIVVVVGVHFKQTQV
ncbi:Conserved_hypothetical protein [Hexamita inflata]|uniref:Uncharacterized protein n=1 Tax=Hexamita inflata TaxID=28002 RepID=A0AA86PKQ0_9EUKA|nr:Conserved hypothetical protein [Hexamita inflata]